MASEIDIEAIQCRLFHEARAKLKHDYELSCEPDEPKAFATVLLNQLKQTPDPEWETKKRTNTAVFEAAVRALGSNSRPWAKFLMGERELKGRLHNYDPQGTLKDAKVGAYGLCAEELHRYFPGTTSRADACAVLFWARLLAATDDYYGFLCDLAKAFRCLAKERNCPLNDRTEILPCVVGYLAQPPTKWKGESYLGSSPYRVPWKERKTPGMRYPLASEFLRNLGWTGCKPDRHVKRLLAAWFPKKTDDFKDRARDLAELIGSKDPDLRTDLAYSLLGTTVSPPSVPLSHVDNLVWLLGAYVEKKGKESDQTYVK